MIKQCVCGSIAINQKEGELPICAICGIVQIPINHDPLIKTANTMNPQKSEENSNGKPINLKKDARRPEGRPRKWNSAKAMQKAIDMYFEIKKPEIIKDDEGNAVFDRSGKPIYEMNPPTVSGLALHLGFVNRQSMYDYEKHSEFSDTIRTARTRCEQWVESAGLSGKVHPAMAQFALKNLGWRDKHELEHTGKNGGAIRFHEMSDDQLQTMIDEEGSE